MPFYPCARRTSVLHSGSLREVPRFAVESQNPRRIRARNKIDGQPLQGPPVKVGVMASVLQKVRNGQGKVCGSIVQDKSGVITLEKRVKASKHFLRVPPGIAFDKAIIEQAQQAGVTLTRVIDTESNTTYTANLEEFGRHGFTVSRGFGEQRAVELRRWDKKRMGDKPKKEAPVQPGLF